MNQKPVIGIVGRFDTAAEDYNVMCCYENVRRSIIKKGGIPLLILPNQDVDYENNDIDELTNEEKNDLIKVIDLCDGILIPGSYRLYEYDRFIYEYALNKDIPILGICGGMQLMALVDVNEKDILKKNETIINHFKKGEKYVHKVNIQNNTKLKSIVKEEVISVNSKHNYHLSKVNNLVISAYSEDGLIEAVEYEDKKFVIGVAWHPESMIDYDESANKIFDAFINECKNK